MSFNSANLFSVEEARNTYAFVVPEFQRGYAWNRDQWLALWDDVEGTAARPDAQHYGGTIMLAERGVDSEDVDLVDGQQRMTSISLMLAALGADGIPIIFRNNEPLQTYYNYHALNQKSLGPSLKQHASYYAKNIADAAAFFAERAAALADDDARQRLVAVLQHRFKLFVLGVHKDFDIHVAFETINNRGKPLSTLEKLKNRLLYLVSNADNLQQVAAASAEVHRCWKQIYQCLGAGAELLADDELLRAHALGWFRNEKHEHWLQNQLFEEEFSSRKPTDVDNILAYVRSLEVAAASWYLLHTPSALPPRLEQRLLWLQRTASSTSKPLLLWALIRLSGQYPELLQTPKRQNAWVEPFTRLVHQAERFSVLVLLVNDRQSNIGQADMNNAAYALAHPGQPVNTTNSKIVPPEDATGAVVYMADFLTAAVYNVRDIDLLEEEEATPRDKYLDPRFHRAGRFDEAAVSSVVAARFRRSSGYYKWHLSKLVIYAWEEKLRGERGLPEKKSWEKFGWDGSVEHIFPQKPVARWQEAILVKGKGKDKIQSAVANSLGNLLLLSVPHNSDVSNGPYIGARGEKNKREHYRSGSYSEAQVAEVCNKWTVVQIAARGIAMMRHAQRTWDFEVVSDDEPLITWLPLLFGEASDLLSGGRAGVAITNQALAPWVKKFSA